VVECRILRGSPYRNLESDTLTVTVNEVAVLLARTTNTVGILLLQLLMGTAQNSKSLQGEI
jgi:hypothetical protein